MSQSREWVRTILDKTRSELDSRIFVAEGYVSQTRNSGAKKIKVKILPEEIETPWLPLLNLGSGSSFVQMGLQKDDEVFVIFFGSYDNGFVLGGFNSDGDNITDLVVKHKSGASITISDNELNVRHSGTVNVEGGTVNVDGTFVNLAGGGQGVARIGDTVATAFGPAPITSGSLRVKSG
jgi:hypothetical protein